MEVAFTKTIASMRFMVPSRCDLLFTTVLLKVVAACCIIPETCWLLEGFKECKLCIDIILELPDDIRIQRHQWSVVGYVKDP